MDYRSVTDSKYFQLNGNYAISKFVNLLFSIGLKKRLQDSQIQGIVGLIIVYAPHPGGVKSQIYRGEPLLNRMLYEIILKVLPWAMLDPIEGALTPLYLALKTPKSGLYFGNCREQPINPYATEEKAEELWKKSCEMVGQAF